ncbi:TIGR03085 family metal-binding protein [Asanoa sp. WMMD1127]|uniref:TIGR03085 family metal-binding protein n=1 Tax=Asanoa sp. WMMD1127 TaxID=3016107 RepID=UPI0024180F21|nr:TIGR03085 family metal-binding protein [Asanoa sp. WMMD1127]MDG4827036.1 TIGR03085 family metal-binding protein [Asanoa sp. WMMD1127]
MSRFVRSERRKLADLFSTLGPDAPTMCEGWATRDLAAHLVIRERRPDASLGMFVPPLRAHARNTLRAFAGRPYPDLIELVRNPPLWSPVSNPLVEGLTNGLEFFVHHEDVRRAQADWHPRDLPKEDQAGLWRTASTIGRLRLRRFPAALLVQAPGFGEFTSGAGGERLRLVGSPGELAYFLAGRQRATRVQIDGPPALADRLRTTPLKI